MLATMPGAVPSSLPDAAVDLDRLNDGCVGGDTTAGCSASSTVRSTSDAYGPWMTHSPAGLVRLADVDALVLKMHLGETVPVEVIMQGISFDGLGMHLDFGYGKADHRLYNVVIRNASRHIPPAVLKNAANQPLTIVEASDEPGLWFVPLFPEAPVVGKTRVNVADDGPLAGIELLVAKSGRLVALLVPDAPNRLPTSITDPPATAPGDPMPTMEELNRPGLQHVTSQNMFRIQLVGDLPADTQAVLANIIFDDDHVGDMTLDAERHVLAVTINQASRRVAHEALQPPHLRPFHIGLDLQNDCALIELWAGSVSVRHYREQVTLGDSVIADLLYDSGSERLVGLRIYRSSMTLHPAFLAQAPPPAPWARSKDGDGGAQD